MHSKLAIFITLVAISQASWFFGPCPTVQVAQNLDPSKVSGQWFEIVRNKDFPYENGKCTYLDYNVSSDGKVYETAHALSKDGQVTSGSGEGYCEDNSGECYVKMGHSPVYGGQFILGTDYDSYLTMYHCSNWWVVNWQYGWIFSRNSQSEVNLDDVDYFDQTYLVADDFMFTDQNDCSAVY